jgi:hypothetical protein
VGAGTGLPAGAQAANAIINANTIDIPEVFLIADSP